MKVKTVRAVQIAHWANRLGHNVEAGLLFLVCKHSLLKFCRLKRKKASQDKNILRRPYPATHQNFNHWNSPLTEVYV